MTIYNDFAEVYDYILQHVDYDTWYRYLKALMLRYVDDPKFLLELGCGTGKFGGKFSRDNYTIFGIDRSINMLRIAKLRAYLNFRILCGDIRNFYLSKKFDFIFAVHDTMNYFLTYAELRSVLQSVKQVMHPGTIFMFDITTEYNIKHYFDNKIMKYNIRNMDIEWTNQYNPKKKIISSLMKFEHKNGSVSHEEHLQRIYSVDEITKVLHQEKFRIIDIFSDYSFSPVKNDTVMINFVTGKA